MVVGVRGSVLETLLGKLPEQDRVTFYRQREAPPVGNYRGQGS